MSVRKGLRPLGLTGILDEATRLVRRRPAFYYALSLPVMVPLLFAVVSFFRFVYWYSGSFDGYEPELVSRSLILTIFFVLRFISHGALCHGVIQDLEGLEVSVWECWKKALLNSFSLCFGGMALWTLAVVGSFFLLLPGLYFAALLAGFSFFVMSDDRRYFAMFFHSFRATVGLITKTMGLHVMLGLGALMFGVGLSLSAPFFLWLFETFLFFDLSVAEKILSFDNPVYPYALFVFVWLVFEPVRVVAQIRLNLDGKIRREGYDLLDRVTRLTGVDLRKAAAFIFVCILFTAGTPGLAQELDEVNLQDFSKRVQRTKTLIDSEMDEIQRGNDVNSSAILNSCRRLDGVTVLFKGKNINVADDGWLKLAEDLEDQLPENQEKRLEIIKARLEYLESGLERLDANDQKTGTTAKAELTDILSENRFQRRKRNLHGKDLNLGFMDSWMSRIVNWLTDWEWPDVPMWTSFKAWVKSWWNKTPTLSNNWKLNWQDWGTAALAVIATLVLAITGWILIKKYALPAMKDDDDDLGQMSIGRTQRPITPVVAYESTEESWRGDARRFASTGQYDYAVRSAFAGLLLTLNGKGWIEFDKTRTNWEYQREVKKKRKNLGAKMAPLTEIFDEKWYGRKECDEGDYQGFRSELDSVIEELERDQNNGE
jgi:hypothetical protein